MLPYPLYKNVVLYTLILWMHTTMYEWVSAEQIKDSHPIVAEKTSPSTSLIFSVYVQNVYFKLSAFFLWYCWRGSMSTAASPPPYYINYKTMPPCINGRLEAEIMGIIQWQSLTSLSKDSSLHPTNYWLCVKKRSDKFRFVEFLFILWNLSAICLTLVWLKRREGGACAAPPPLYKLNPVKAFSKPYTIPHLSVLFGHPVQK